ncbi:MAG TPA: hypothetical protein VMQ38_21570 [Mycobacterium sp.]|jgi:hypothetical protein|nr:hypothetical protein [Mycobacterium sp.]
MVKPDLTLEVPDLSGGFAVVPEDAVRIVGGNIRNFLGICR